MKKAKKKNAIPTALQSIKEFCLSCSGGSPKDVKECIIIRCPLYPYRLGTNPKPVAKKAQSPVKTSVIDEPEIEEIKLPLLVKLKTPAVKKTKSAAVNKTKASAVNKTKTPPVNLTDISSKNKRKITVRKK